MDAEEGEFGVGHGVNQVAHQKLARFFELIILAAKRDDFCRGILPGGAGEPVGLQAAAPDDKFRLEIAGGGCHRPTASIWRGLLQAGAELNLAARLTDEFGQFFADARIVHDAFLGNMNGGEAGGMRFDFLNFPGVEFAQSGQAVGVTARPQILQARQLIRGGGDHNFAALFMGHAVRAAEGEHLLQALHGTLRLGGAGLVVKPRMEDPAIVAGLVRGESGFLFQQQQFQFGPGFEEAVGGGEANNTAAGHNDVVRGFQKVR